MTAAALAIAAGIAGYIAGHRKRKREQQAMRADMERIGAMCINLCAAEREGQP